MHVCAVTGSIACGKSTVTRMCHELAGVPIISADEVARTLMQPGTPLTRCVCEAFPGCCHDSHGPSIDRALLSAAVFADPSSLAALNALTHPAIMAAVGAWVDQLQALGHTLVVVEIPLLFEANLRQSVDSVIVAACSPEAQRQRLRARGYSEEEQQRRINAQWAADDKVRAADYVVRTDGSMADTARQVTQVMDRLQHVAKGNAFMTETNPAAPQRGFTLWLTGLSGAGKSTLTQRLALEFRADLLRVEVLDGDEVRENLSAGLTFSKEDRDINVRRIGFVARLLARNGIVAMTAAISPYRDVRNEVRALHEAEGIPFVEVWANASVDALTQRDVKGLYKRALAGEVAHFTGISDPYEEPLHPDVEVRTDRQSVDESIQSIKSYLREKGLIG